MKKIISLILTVVMVMSLTTVAFAAEGDQTNVGTGDYSTNVTGTYVAGTASNGTVFSVDIAWSGMSFTYHAEQAPVWDAAEHSYSKAVAAYWEGEGTITVTNHSNAKISAVPTYKAAAGYDDADMTFSTDELKLASAADTNAAVTGTITVTPDGFLPEMSAAATIGSITVTIAQDTNVTIDEARALYAQAEALLDSAKNSGAYNTYTDDFDSMSTEMRNMSDCFDVYEAVENGNLAWGDEYSYEDWQEVINEHYEALLTSYNNCKNLSGL